MSQPICGLPSYSFTCQLSPEHDGQHEYDDGITRAVWYAPGERQTGGGEATG